MNDTRATLLDLVNLVADFLLEHPDKGNSIVYQWRTVPCSRSCCSDYKLCELDNYQMSIQLDNEGNIVIDL